MTRPKLHVEPLFIGDVRDGLREFARQGQRVQTCVTSPPYWGLRDYGTAQWDGGSAGCDHTATRRGHGDDEKQAGSAGTSRDPIRGGDCRLCGARRIDKQIGIEPTIAQYVASLVEVFALLRQILAADGTLWLNLGDSYSGPSGGYDDKYQGAFTGRRDIVHKVLKGSAKSRLPDKNLLGVPWEVAFALRADGWYLRQDIIWSKLNPMPESVTDRCTKAHEYIFLLSKSARYYYNAKAIAEPMATKPHAPGNKKFYEGRTDARRVKHDTKIWGASGLRNKRSVWTLAAESYTEAHFATFPTALVEPCILAGSRVGDTVLDPFMGSGTVARVANKLGRKWLGCELNREYVDLAGERSKPKNFHEAEVWKHSAQGDIEQWR